jgi:tRNA pseudouridine55 synthase
VGNLQPREVGVKTKGSSFLNNVALIFIPAAQSDTLSAHLMDGIILIDKPAGPTSAEVVRQVKHRVKPARVGHLGTLDPFATGVLPILVGEATKLAPFLHDGEKYYVGLIALGSETDTLDRTGEVVRTAAIPQLDTAVLATIAARFTGMVTQTPPIFSAIKRGGVPLYKLARRGDEVAPPPPREVRIAQVELAVVESSSIRFSVVCSPGTYMRSFARDIGIALGSAAHLAALCRTRSGLFAIEKARSLAEVLAALDRGESACVTGLRDAIPDLPEIDVDAAIEKRLRNGDSRALDGIVPPQAQKFFKVVADGHLLAIAQATSRVTAVIARVFGEP